MFDIKINDAEGEPTVTVTLTAVEVESIYSALFTAADNHTESVFETVEKGEHKNRKEWWGVRAQSESQRTVGKWQVIHDLISEPFWNWVNDTEDEEVSA